MGTNFYWRATECPTCGQHDPAVAVLGEHIGKRRAAGLYCWGCGVTLCKGRVHYGDEFHDACPKCGSKPAAEGLKDGSPAGVELGFSGPRDRRPSGVRGCSSFTWAEEPAAVRRRCEERMDDPVVVDEYRRAMTGGEFLRMLASNCPIEFTDMVGQVFS